MEFSNQVKNDLKNVVATFFCSTEKEVVAEFEKSVFKDHEYFAFTTGDIYVIRVLRNGKKYSVVVDGNTVKITNNGTRKSKSFDIREFIYGQSMFNEVTDKYPDYVHNELWQQHYAQRR